MVIVKPSGSISFNYTGTSQSWVVPAGVTSIQVELNGAQGGGNDAGLGGKVVANIPVASGSTLFLVVGGRPIDQNPVYGGGGNGGNNSANSSRNGFAGGGLSGIYLNSISHANALAIAGGGGGNSGATNMKIGGSAGFPNGNNGGQGNYSGREEGGKGATQNAGGTAGVGFDSQVVNPTNGTALNGGNGGNINVATWDAGGGGGAGYFGGGGGAGGGLSVGAGGGGSSYVINSASNVIYTGGVKTGNGSITISY